MLALGASDASANEKTCEQEMTEIKALIEQMPNDADKHVAEYQYGKAQQFLEQGNEHRCLIYLESARGAIDAEQMRDN
jgi:hypothetical protein